MAEYTSRENTLMMFNRFFQMCENKEQKTLVLDMKQAFLELPTVDAAEVKHGYWEDNNNGSFTCSVCGGKSSRMDWCGRCGAKMGKKEGDVK